MNLDVNHGPKPTAAATHVASGGAGTVRRVTPLLPVFDLDGTLLDSDEALVAAFVALGVPRGSISFGHVIGDECARLGLDVLEYVDRYDTTIVQPFAGTAALIAQLDRWALCSNKHPVSGSAELARLGWSPEVALFTDAFDGPKRLEPVLERLGVRSSEVIFIGDTAHDRSCAVAAGAAFALAGWNPRAVTAEGDVVLRRPGDLLRLLR